MKKTPHTTPQPSSSWLVRLSRHLAQIGAYRLWAILALFAGATLSLCYALGPFRSFDVYWHLRTGRDFWEHGLSPWRDSYSFTYFDQPIRGAHWFFQILVGKLVDIFGTYAGEWVRGLIWGANLAVIYLSFVRRNHWNFLSALLLLSTAIALMSRPYLRPEMIFLFYIVGGIYLFDRIRRTPTAWNWLMGQLFMLFWINTHVGSPIGYVMFAGLCIDLLWRIYKKHKTVMLCGADPKTRIIIANGLIALAIGFLNKDLEHPLIATLQFSPFWAQAIAEFIPKPFVERALLERIQMTLLASITPWLFLRRKWGYLLLVTALLPNAFQYQRFYLFTTFICAWILNHELNVLWRFLRSFDFVKGQVALGVFVVLFSGFTLFDFYRFFMLSPRLSLPTVPALVGIDDDVRRAKDVIEFFNQNDFSGRVFNEYGDGGYLIYRSNPRTRFFIDGRTNILYPPEHMQLYHKAAMSVAGFQETLKQYDFDWAITKHFMDDRAHFINALSSGFGIFFMGAGRSLLKKGHTEFSEIEKVLTNPRCLDQLDLPKLKTELTKARARHSTDVKLIGLIETAMEVAPKEEFDEKWFAEQLRQPQRAYALEALGFLAHKHKVWESTRLIFATYPEKFWTSGIKLALTDYLIATDQPREAYWLLLELLKGRNPEWLDHAIIWRILRIKKQIAGKPEFKIENLLKLLAELKDLGLDTEQKKPSERAMHIYPRCGDPY